MKIEDDTPEAVGRNAFINLMMPIVLQFTSADLAHLYSGLYSSFCGSVVADFGPRVGKDLIRRMYEITIEMTPSEQIQ